MVVANQTVAVILLIESIQHFCDHRVAGVAHVKP